jgi:thiamine kinase-like enzyme
MDNINTILKENYNLNVINVVPQKGGWASLAYKVFTDEHVYFLKVYEKDRASTEKWTALIDEYMPILFWLLQNSILKDKIVVPIWTINGNYKCEDEKGIYIVYEYIVGETIGDKDLTEEQIEQLSHIITELHSYGGEISQKTDGIKEDFTIPYLQKLRYLFIDENHTMPDDIREVIDPYMEQITNWMDELERLSISLKKSNLKMVLCHTDIHNWNLMQSQKQLMLIDWEGLILAPAEADMIFLVKKPYYDKFLSIYQITHRYFKINPDALLFYQVKRKLEDVWEFSEQLFFDQQNNHDRAETLDNLAKELSNL